MSLWVSLLCVNEAREENRVADKEDGRVIADQIPDALVGVELHCEAPGIASGISRTALSTLSEDGKKISFETKSLADK